VIWAFWLHIEYYENNERIGRESDTSFYAHLISALVLFLMCWLALMLLIFHCWLGLTNQTTYQMILIQRQSDISFLEQNHFSNFALNNQPSDEDNFSADARAVKKLTHWSYWKPKGIAGLMRNIYSFSTGNTERVYQISPQSHSININYANNLGNNNPLTVDSCLPPSIQ
jgi:hypothetical protein